MWVEDELNKIIDDFVSYRKEGNSEERLEKKFGKLLYDFSSINSCDFILNRAHKEAERRRQDILRIGGAEQDWDKADGWRDYVEVRKMAEKKEGKE